MQGKRRKFKPISDAYILATVEHLPGVVALQRLTCIRHGTEIELVIREGTSVWTVPLGVESVAERSSSLACGWQHPPDEEPQSPPVPQPEDGPMTGSVIMLRPQMSANAELTSTATCYFRQ